MVHLQVLKDVVDLYVSHLFRLAGDADGVLHKIINEKKIVYI